MADEENIDLQEAPEGAEIPKDNARDLTSALVFTTFALSLLAFLVLEKAMGKWFMVGLFK